MLNESFWRTGSYAWPYRMPCGSPRSVEFAVDSSHTVFENPVSYGHRRCLGNASVPEDATLITRLYALLTHPYQKELRPAG
jgi:hypothetical protein